MALNAVDRFWNARRTGNWDSLAAQLRNGVSITMLHEDTELSRDQFLTFLRVMHHDATTTVERTVIGRGLQIGVLAIVARPKATFVCSGFYDLREGLIEVIQELWIPRGGANILDLI